MADQPRVVSVAEMEAMTPQERADTVDGSIVRSWDDVPEPFRTEVLTTARELGGQLQRRA